jgi:hypothetical protein
MFGDHAKREIVTGEKAMGSRRTLSRESSDKYKEESSSSIKSHRKGDKKKKKMKKVVTTRTTLHLLPHPTPSLQLRSATSVGSIVRCLFSILAFQSVLLYFRFP